MAAPIFYKNSRLKPKTQTYRARSISEEDPTGLFERTARAPTKSLPTPTLSLKSEETCE